MQMQLLHNKSSVPNTGTHIYITHLINKLNKRLNLQVQVFYFSFPSELNTLDGTWNVFLNEAQPPERIISDFKKIEQKLEVILTTQNHKR